MVRSTAWLRFVASRAFRVVEDVLAPGDEDAFLAYLSERMPADEDPGPVLERLHLADLAFAFLLSEWRPTAVEQFERDHVPSLVAAARRATSTLDAAEIVQEVRVHVLVGTDASPPKIRDYRGEGRLRSWLRVVVVRAALNRASRSKELPVEDAFFEAMVGPDDLALTGRRESELVKEALRHAIPLLSNREKSLVQLSYIDGASLEELGGMYGVHRQTIARWLELARDRVKRAIETELRDRLGVSPSEVESVVRNTMGTLDSPVARLLTER